MNTFKLKLSWSHLVGAVCAVTVLCLACAVYAAAGSAAAGQHAWWFWPLCLFIFTFAIGLVAPVSGVGGGVMFVPITTAFFPFSIDFIRGTGLVMAMISAFSSAPYLMKKGLANLKLMTPLVVVSVVTSIIGGIAGLWISNAFPTGKDYLTIALGLILFVIVVVMSIAKKLEYPELDSDKIDGMSQKLDIGGSWYEPTLDKVVHFKTGRLPIGLFAFGGVGFIAGMFGLGAGWANVPVLNMIMGAPIKVATSTSMAIISVNDAAAFWIYLANGALLPLVLLPSVIGITIGARIGAKLAEKAKPTFVRYLVIFILLAASVVDVIKGLGSLHIIPKII